MELVTEAEVVDYPAGRARDDPNQNPTLDPPKSALFTCSHTSRSTPSAQYALSVIKRSRLRPSVCLSRRSTAAAVAGGFVAERGRLQQIPIDSCCRTTCGLCKFWSDCKEVQHRPTCIASNFSDFLFNFRYIVTLRSLYLVNAVDQRRHSCGLHRRGKRVNSSFGVDSKCISSPVSFCSC